MTSTTETDCPSHIEARERVEGLVSMLEVYGEHEVIDLTVRAHAMAADLRTLLATPTQGDISPSRDHDPAGAAKLEADFVLAEAAFREGLALGYLSGRVDPPDEHLKLHDDAVNEAWSESATRKALSEREDALLSSRTEVAGKVPGMQNNTSGGPTQEGVGREEIARALAHEASVEADGSAASWELSPRERKALYLRMADRILSLLPAPKLGEDHGAAFDRFRDEALGCQRAKPQQPAPGAPEGWREKLLGLCAWWRLRAADCATKPKRLQSMIYTNCADALEQNIAALTSSSAKPVEEDARLLAAHKGVSEGKSLVIRQLEAENEALAQSNRRLREGLTQAYADMSIVQAALDGGAAAGDVSLREAIDAIRPIIAGAANDAALKDNGHG